MQREGKKAGGGGIGCRELKASSLGQSVSVLYVTCGVPFGRVSRPGNSVSSLLFLLRFTILLVAVIEWLKLWRVIIAVSGAPRFIPPPTHVLACSTRGRPAVETAGKGMRSSQG